MGQIDKKLKNQLFKVAVDYIYKEHLASGQGELAKKIGISESALSRIMNDKKFVGDETLRKMNEASVASSIWPTSVVKTLTAC